MMVGVHDRQPIRERGPAAPAPRRAAQPLAAGGAGPPASRIAETARSASADQQNAEQARTPTQTARRLRRHAEPQAARRRRPARRIPDRTLGGRLCPAHRRDDRGAEERERAGVLGRPAAAARARATAAAVYLNELYRSRAEKAGIIYIDVWDGFVDEGGRYVLQGPDFEGQTRRLRVQ